MSKTYLLTLASALMLAGCSNTDDLLGGGSSTGTTPLSLNFSFAGSSVQSKAGVANVKDAFNSNEKIGVYLRAAQSTGTPVYAENYDGITYDNLQYNATTKKPVNASGTDDETKAPLLSQTTGYIYGYHPYTSTAGELAFPSVTMTAANAQEDYMYASAAAAGDAAFSPVSCNDHDNSKTLYMHHAKALLEFTINNTSSSGNCKINKISVSGPASGSTISNAGTIS